MKAPPDVAFGSSAPDETGSRHVRMIPDHVEFDYELNGDGLTFQNEATIDSAPARQERRHYALREATIVFIHAAF